MLHAEAHEGGQGAVVLGDGAFHLDLPERDEEALLELGVEAEQPGRLPEVAAGRGERVHGCGGAGSFSSPAPTSATGKKEGGPTETEQDRGPEALAAKKGKARGKKDGFLSLFRRSRVRGVPGESGASCVCLVSGGGMEEEGINR